MAWLVIAIAIAIVLVAFLQRLRGGWEPGRFVFAACILALGGLTVLAISSSDPATQPGQRETAGESPTTEPPSSVPMSDAPTGDADPSGSLVRLRYEVAVEAGSYGLFQVNASGQIVDTRPASFDGASRAPVDRVQGANGQIHWRIVLGGLAGWSFVPERSGEFTVREVLRADDGSVQYRPIAPDA